MTAADQETLRVLMGHRSIRQFKADPIGEEELETIVRAAQMASTSSGVQAFSVIVVKNKERKHKLAELSGNQAYVEECPLFLVWCADMHRLEIAGQMSGGEAVRAARNTEQFLIATVDTALAAQNAAIAAESMGLGVVYIGGIRNHIEEVSGMLSLPELVYPVFGMCVGYPAQDPLPRPRLPLSTVLHQERYEESGQEEGIAEYDRIYREYMSARSGGRMNGSWSEAMAAKIPVPARTHLKRIWSSKAFALNEQRRNRLLRTKLSFTIETNCSSKERTR
ncbi:oxygen-insensitive NADPH nitroreductase [Gorillibacterium timonense]|uniref:oxygen-insensitive NADPH nitroreductase n=1 Tax=Gorillibacterium timonense TaxID=1689269 RepID=UPI0009E870B7|nr:oxygen-insensitive NADPH nitroreductase [Gorillibacterium timonense]